MSDEQQKPAFDPTRHLTKVSGRDYLEVKFRLVWFHEHHPNGSIVTELIQHQNNTAVFRASVSWPYDDGTATRTGYGMESSDNFGDYLEKAETKAIGRALGAAGFGTQFCDDFVSGDRIVDSPVQRPHAPQRRETRRYAQPADAALHDAQTSAQATVAPDHGHASPAQADFIKGLVRDLEWKREDVERFLDVTYGVKRISELGSRQDVSAFIDHLKELKAQNEPATVG